MSGTLLRQAGRTRYAYDAQGRLVQTVRRLLTGGQKAWTYGYDAHSRLMSAVTPDGGRWSYLYDPLGRRVAKRRYADDGSQIEEIRFSWDGSVLVEQDHRSAASQIVSIITWDYEPASFSPLAQERRVFYADAPQETVDQAFHAIVTDAIGTPTELVTPEGDIVWRRTAGLWGGASMEETACLLRFRGQYHDSETGFDDNLNRLYDPETGRYTSADPLGLAPAANHHGNVENPMVWCDPLGLAKTPKPAPPPKPSFIVGSDGVAVTAVSPSFVEYNDVMFPVPEGAYGPFPVDSGKGFQYIHGTGGGPGLDPKVTSVRFMNPVTGGKYPHPDGYVNYMSSATPKPQAVDPKTGKTVKPSDPAWHLDAC